MFAVLYIVCLPLFLIKLIREGIGIVMELNTIHENLGREIVILKTELKALKQKRKWDADKWDGEAEEKHEARVESMSKRIAEKEQLIVQKRTDRAAEYFQCINDPIRKLASTSLYAAYEYDWRFWKMIQLIENLLLVCISLFVPQDIGSGIGEGRVMLGAVAIGSCFLFVCYIRPYYDNWEGQSKEQRREQSH